MNSKASTVAFANPPFFLGHPVHGNKLHIFLQISKKYTFSYIVFNTHFLTLQILHISLQNNNRHNPNSTSSQVKSWV